MIASVEENKLEKYKIFVEDGIKKKLESPFVNLYAQTILGEKEFIKNVEKIVGSKNIFIEDVPSLKMMRKYLTPEEIIEKIANYFSISVEEIVKSNKRNNIHRQVCLYFVHKYTDYNNSKIGNIFGISDAAVSEAVKTILRKQNNMKLHKILQEIERFIK